MSCLDYPQKIHGAFGNRGDNYDRYFLVHP